MHRQLNVRKETSLLIIQLLSSASGFLYTVLNVTSGAGEVRIKYSQMIALQKLLAMQWLYISKGCCQDQFKLVSI